jgi:hypothetical protein
MIEDIFYFDDEKILRLANQTVDGAIISSTAEREVSASGSTTAKVGWAFGSLFELLGIGKLDVEASKTQGRGEVLKQTSTNQRSSEGAYQAIVAHLRSEHRLHRDLDAAKIAIAASGGSVFCEVIGAFVPAGYDSGAFDEWRKVANRTGMLVTALSADRRITMGMSLSKIIDLRSPHIGKTSHLAVMTRGRGAVPLRVFGRFDGFYIKPLVATHL